MQQLTGTAKFPGTLAVSGLDLATNPYHRELVQRFVSTELVEAGHVRLVHETLKDLHGREKGGRPVLRGYVLTDTGAEALNRKPRKKEAS